MEKTTGRKHAYIACVETEDGWRGVCKCGKRTRPYVNKKTAQRNLVDHIVSRSHGKGARRRKTQRKGVAA